MEQIRITRWLLAACVVAAPLLPGPVLAQDAGAPCGRDPYGRPLQCSRPPPGVDLEAACMTTGRLENCIPYHRTSCEIRGFPAACRLYNLGQNCFGGDPNACSYYRSLLRANTACQLDGDQGACTWLGRQNF